jgi:ankyrin repeat protein
MLRALRDGSLETVQELLDGGAIKLQGPVGVIVSEEDLGRSTWLHVASRLRQGGAVKLLIDHGADIHAQDDAGLLPVDQVRLAACARAAHRRLGGVLVYAESKSLLYWITAM